MASDPGSPGSQTPSSLAIDRASDDAIHVGPGAGHRELEQVSESLTTGASQFPRHTTLHDGLFPGSVRLVGKPYLGITSELLVIRSLTCASDRSQNVRVVQEVKAQ